MKKYEAYVEYLEELSLQALTGAVPIDPELIALALDGQPGLRLRELVNLEDRRVVGAFFTSSHLRERALAYLAPTINEKSIIFDSSMGVGDLLVAAAAHLPVAEDLDQTFRLWGQQLRGVDLEEEFVRGTKARLFLLAASRCGVQPNNLLPSEDYFPLIRQGNGLDALEDIAAASHLALNPSYSALESPPACTWSTGKVSTAAVFIEQSVTKSTKGTQIVAILPDVLRTGSRYEKWRQVIEDHLTDVTVEVIGKFDAWTDVDVFILHGTADYHSAPQTIQWWKSNELREHQSVNDFFKVSVGPVVPHRDLLLGEAHPYITAATITGMAAFDADTADERQYSGTTFRPPFVALRRTSRPGQRGRAAGVMVTGTRPVAVENHIIGLVPRDGSAERCSSLLAALNDGRTAKWLDERIRCRHLTVTSVRELPWWSQVNDERI